MRNYDKKTLNIIIVIICTLWMIWTQRNILVVNTGFGYRVLELMYAACNVPAMVLIVNYLVIEKARFYSQRTYFKYYVKLWLCQVVAMLPLFTQNFMYGDDLWGYTNSFNGDISGGVYFSRPFASFLAGPLLDTSFFSLKYFRLYNSISLLVFGCILFRYITDKVGDKNRAFLFSAVSVSCCTAVDCIAYASIYPINASLVLSAISFVAYDKATAKKGREKAGYLLLAGMCLFSAFNMYQMGTSIVFLLYVIEEKFNLSDKALQRFKNAIIYLIFYGIIALVYLMGAKGIQILTGQIAGQSARGQLVLDVHQLLDKAKWFISVVCPQALNKITGALFGNVFYVENNMFYTCTYAVRVLGIIISFVLILFVLVSVFQTAYRHKQAMYIFIVFMSIPLSFWPFLILPESYFLTYYGIAIILLFLWYVIDGIAILHEIIMTRFKCLRCIDEYKMVLITLFTGIVVLQSNNYAENTWVNYNRDSYEYLANTIMSEFADNESINTIIVKGNMGPYAGGHDYVIFCIQDILIELGYDPSEYTIVQSENGFYPTIFSDDVLIQMREVLEKDQIEKILEYYIHDDMYGRWLFTWRSMEATEKEFLRTCFLETGVLAVETEQSISISLVGFNIRNTF